MAGIAVQRSPQPRPTKDPKIHKCGCSFALVDVDTPNSPNSDASTSSSSIYHNKHSSKQIGLSEIRKLSKDANAIAHKARQQHTKQSTQTFSPSPNQPSLHTSCHSSHSLALHAL